MRKSNRKSNGEGFYIHTWLRNDCNISKYVVYLISVSIIGLRSQDESDSVGSPCQYTH